MLARALVGALLLSPAAHARVLTYVESNPSNDADQVALGYPVPQAVEQSQPLAGFRSLSGIYLRHRELSLEPGGPRLEEWGRSLEDRPIEALCFGPETATQVLYTGGIHAREWASPEAVLGLAEWLSLETEQPLVRWVAQTVPLCLLSVVNPDGLAHTQQIASQTRICEAPEQPGVGADCPANVAVPRDGRMRRKNLRDSDNDLSTTSNALLGVDLNRNVGPFWASSSQLGQSSSSPDRLIYHGEARGSEPETALLESWVRQAQADQLRLYMDVHSFGRLYFWNCFGIPRLDATAADWVERFRRAARTAYRSVPTGNPSSGDGCGPFGIGATDELFGFELSVPAYTLELEPAQSAAEYGGRGVTRDGFILPEAIVPAMRQDARQMLLLAASLTEGRPWLRQVVARDDGAEVVYEAQWQAAGAQRQLRVLAQEALQPGQTLRLELQFDRPMRWLGPDNAVDHYPGLEQSIPPEVQWRSNSTTWVVDTSTGNWVNTEEPYGLSTYRIETSVPNNWNVQDGLLLLVRSADNGRQPIDADPSSKPKWCSGGFIGHEDGFDEEHCFAAPQGSSCTVLGTQSTEDSESCIELPATSSGGGSGGSSLWFALLLLLRCRRYRR